MSFFLNPFLLNKSRHLLKVTEVRQINNLLKSNEFTDSFKGVTFYIAEKTKSNDNRSYHINSDKIFNRLGFKAKRNIEEAVRDLCVSFKKGSTASTPLTVPGDPSDILAILWPDLGLKMYRKKFYRFFVVFSILY